MMAIAALTAIFALGPYATMSAPQQQSSEPIELAVGLCTAIDQDPGRALLGQQTVSVKGLLQGRQGVPAPENAAVTLKGFSDTIGAATTAVRVVPANGDVLITANLPPPPPVPAPLPPPVYVQVSMTVQDTTASTPSVDVILFVQVQYCQQAGAVGSPPNNPVPIPQGIFLCVGEGMTVYFGLIHFGGIVNTIEWSTQMVAPVAVADPAGAIKWDYAPPIQGPADFPAYRQIDVWGVLPGVAQITATVRMQPLGAAPFTTPVAVTNTITVVLCAPPPPVDSLCPPGTIRLNVPARVPPYAPLPNPVNPPAPPPFVGAERFEVGLTRGAARPGGPPQRPFPAVGRGLVGERTAFFVWGAPYLEPAPTLGRISRWVAYRGYFKCVAPVPEPADPPELGFGLIPGWKDCEYFTLATSVGQLATAALSGGEFLAAAHQNLNSLAIIDLASKQLKMISVGLQPHSVEMTRDGRRAFVGNFGSGEISVVDIPNQRVIETIRVGRQTAALTFDPTTNKLYAVNFGDNNVAVVQYREGGSQVVGAVRGLREPIYVALSPDGRRGYVSSQRKGQDIVVFDTASTTIVGRVPVPNLELRKLAVSPDGKRLYAAARTDAQGTGRIAVIDTASLQIVQQIPVEAYPLALTVTPSGGCLIVTHSFPNKVSFIDLKTEKVLAVLPSGQSPQAVAIGGELAYVTNLESDAISVYNLGSCQ